MRKCAAECLHGVRPDVFQLRCLAGKIRVGVEGQGLDSGCGCNLERSYGELSVVCDSCFCKISLIVKKYRKSFTCFFKICADRH